MARDSFDESKSTKKKVTKKKTEVTKPQSSSVTKPKTTTTKVNKVASKSTFLGGGAPVQKVEQAASKPKTVKKPASQKKQTVTKQDQINQKMYGTTKPTVKTKTQRTKRDTKPVTSKSQRQANAEANMNLKQRNIRDTAPVQSRRTATTTAAQRQKMGMPTQQDLQDARASRRELANSVRSSVREATSEENKGFMQRQKSGTLTASDKKRIEQTNQRRAEVARNTRDVAKKAVIDTGSGYAQSIYDLTELTAGNKNGTQAKAMKMGLDPVRDRRRIAELEREQKYTAAESKRRRDELFQKQEQRQAEWDERTKNAKGLEKAWYGAVESGTGMVADTLVGAATGTGQFGALASMGLRTYGSSANQARKEGATDKEARLYGLAQSAKEVGTELMFQGAGLAKAAYGKTGLSLADKSANILTKGLTGLKADAVGAGVRALGGTAEENIEEIAGWMADPLIKELTYGKAVRNRMKENLRANIPQIGSDADAAHVASYFSTPKFTDDLTNEYVKSGMSRDKASALAAEMRDYYVAYYSGDKGRLDALEEDLAAKLSGQDKLSFRSWSMDELKDTLTSTTLLTLATGLPGAVTTSAKGNRIFDSDEVKAAFGNDAARKVADAVKNTSNKEMSLKAETMEDRLKSGKDLTGTQKYDLYQGYIEKVNETAKKARASNGVVENARQEQNLVPTMGVDRAGNTVYAKETQREYDEKYAETAVTAESLRRFMESDNSISDDEIRRTDAAIKAVSDLHVGGLTIGDAHEFAYGNNLARETLKIEEGIDLDKYIVRKADGTVDLAATNEATENALFRINAENAIKAAQAETEVYIDDTRGNIDKDLLTRFGNNGQAVWKEVNKDLDPRDLKNYLTNANAASYFYSAGRNTDMSVDTAVNRFADTFKTVDKSVMKRAFAAGARDRIIANTPGYGQTVESGSNIQLKKTEPVITGQLIMDDDVVLADSDQSAYLALAMSTNTNIHIVSNLNAMGKDGKPIINQATGLPVQLNGMSHGNDIYLNMNEASEKNLGYVFMHEMTHQIKQYAPNEYLSLENLVRDRWFNKDASGMQKAIKDRIDLYSEKGGQQLTEEEAVEEIIADAMAEAMDDPNFAAQVCEQDINLGQAILNSIRAALRSIRNMFANTEFKNDRFHNSLLSYLGILDEAEKMWLNALATAKQNKANGLIADWQDRANKQNAPRLSVAEEQTESMETTISDADRKTLNNEGIEELDDGTTARYSVTSWGETNKDKKLKALVAAGHNKEAASKWIDDVNSIASIILDDPERLDYEADRTNKFLKPNGDYYKYTLDASTLCDKRRIYQGTYNAIQHIIPNAPLMQDDVVRIRTLLKNMDHKAPCGICYVESQRKNLGQYAKEWYDSYARKDEIKLADVTTSDGLKELKKTNPEVASDFEKAMAAKGVSSPKVVKLRTDYREDIMRMRPATIEYLNSIGGLRFHSFSDFETPHLIDTMQAVMDMATKNLMGMAYAKVPNFAAVFGPTGIKINLSLIAKTDENGNAVHDENGRLVFDSVEGIPFEEASKWRDAYPDNVAFILVGKDKEHTLEAINDDRVDFVIPFHRSKWSAEDMRRLGLVGYEDFATGHQENGVFVSEFWDYNKTGKENAERYLEVCKEKGVTPIFEQLLKENEDGTYSLKEDGSTDNYWKLLVEGKMYNHFTKKGAPQKPVQPNFNMDEARRVLNEYEGGANTLPVADDVVKAFIKEYKQNHPDVEIADAKMSISVELDDAYMDAVDSNNMDEAQRLVDEAARMAGFDTPLLHHGTPSFGFTTFDLARGENIIFATDSRLTAETYSGETSRNRISEKSKVDIDQLYGQGLLDKAKQHLSRYKDYRLMSGSEKEDLLDEARSDMASIANDVVGGFIAEHRDAFDEEKLGIANRIVDSLNKISTAWNDDDVQTAWDDFQDAIWDLKWADESIQLELSREIQSGGALQFLKNRISDFMYAGDLYARGDSTSEYVYDNQLALELGAELNKGIYGLYGNPGKQLVIDANGSNWNQIIPPDELGLYGPQRTRSIAEAAKAKGYDSVLFKDLRDNGGATAYNGESDVYMFFNPNQVKSADPVTYREDGSVIPLSERFDPTNNDIRYSLPTQDSDGNILTDGQMEYFKNSQARDEFGRLVPVYHGTFRGPRITIFDGSNDGYWFTSDMGIAQDYSMGYEMGVPGAQIGTERNPYDSDDEYFAKKGIRIEQDAEGDWRAVINRNGREHYWGAAESKEELIESLYTANENEDLFDSQFTLRDYYPVYLNLENPRVIDCNGSMHDDVNGTGMTTRELAAEAKLDGYDGIIFRNVVDPFEAHDVYVAFSSNQVKDINNENPTENPDIRYSITDEDEAMSHMAHDYAYDTSYEALAYYEDLIAADASTETTYEKAKNYIAKDVDEFYAGLTRYADGMKFDDPVLEEGRTRMAKSKQDYFNSNVAKWNDAWLTDGEVLDPKSIKKPVRDLVTAVMRESNTNKKYKTDLVNKAIIDIRLAYYYAKQGRTDVADALLWHSAHRMIDGVEFYADDTSYEEYKGLRDYMKNTRIQLGEDYWSDVDFGAFRKENFGRMNLVKGETNVDKVYAELEDMFPGLFDSEEYDNAPDQLMHMASVLDSVQPYAEAYSSEYCAEWATDIASDLLNIMQNGKELQSIADRYTNKYEAKIKAMKARHAEAMLKVRQQRDEGINAQKAKFKEYKEQQKEKRAHNKYFESIQKTHKKLTERLLTNTADKNIPEQYKRDIARLLAAFDLQTVGSKKYEARTGRQGQKTIKMAALKTALNNIENKSHEFHVSDAITDIIDELLGKDAGNGYSRSIEGLTIDELSASELNRIDKLLKALLHEFNTYRDVKVGAKRQQVEDIGKAQVDSALEHAKIFGAGRDYQNLPGGIDRIINLDEVTPTYMFRHIDPEKSGLALMFKELRRSFDKYVRNQAQLNEWMNEIVGKYHKKSKLPWRKYGAGELENWRSENYAQTFNLENGTVTLTPAQMMSLYCLSNRTQAYNHMTGAGIVVAPVSFNATIMSDLKKKPNKALPVKLTDADIKQIVTQLTPDQVKVADDLQKLMADKMAAWGNEASMDVLGIELFGEPDYFPIKSDKAALEKDLNDNEFVEAIRNFGFTKAVQPGARNAIMIDDIFDVVTEHCNNMNLYNAYSEAMNDFMKVYNYRDFRDDGSEYTVQQAVAHAFGSKATTFIMTFMRDLNGNVSGRASGIENLYNSMLGNAKKAAVFANLRVAAQQPTAITRAFAAIDPKYLKGVKIEKGAMDELFEHCPIALWKSWGYYDINMGKSIEDIMMNNGRWLEDAATELYGALDNVTWTAIWQMVKAEMKDTHPEVKEGTDEYWELCNDRMTEVVDLTQVVDSPFHRSHAMRDKGIFVKAATSFMAEPTLTFNMLRDGVIRSRETWRKGDKAEAAKIAARIGAVALLQAATVAGAAGLVDALRKKKPDKDDDDERLAHLWWENTVNNFHDEMKVWNKIYFVKDIASIFDGWDNSNLALQGIQKFALGYRQLTGDPYARSSAAWYENAADGIGYMTGVPVKTIRTGLKNAMGFMGIHVDAIDSIGEKLDSIPEKNKNAEIDESGMIGKLFSLAVSDDGKSLLDMYAEKKGYRKISGSADNVVSEPTSESTMTEDDLPDNLTDEQKQEILKAGEKRSEKARSAEEQEKRDYDTMLYDAMKASAGLEGEEYNKKIWQSVSKGYKSYIEEGNYARIEMMRRVVEEAGGDLDYFDKQVNEASKTALKKSIKSASDMTEEEYYAQKSILGHLRQSGMTDGEISEYIYKSDTRTDLQVAMRINDEDAIFEELTALVNVGFTQQDFEKAYKNRNRVNLKNYKDKGGKYSDRLKSMGTFIWPTDGVITSHFGYRNAPTAGASSNHGVVISAGANGGYGNSVGIKHDNGMITWYNHLYDWNVKVGDTVAQGQQIAQVGSTGISTGPHLDFKIMDTNGNPVDPEKYLATR